MSGPKYGNARIDMETFGKLWDSFKNLAEEAKIEKLNSQIVEIISQTDKLIEDFEIKNYYEIVKKALKKFGENADLLALDELFRGYRSVALDKFSLEGNSTDIYISELNYMEKKQKLEDIFANIEIKIVKIKQILDENGKLSEEEKFYKNFSDFKKIKQFSLQSNRLKMAYEGTLEGNCKKNNFAKLKKAIDGIFVNSQTDDSYKISQILLVAESFNAENSVSFDNLKYLELENTFMVYSEILGESCSPPNNILDLENAVNAFQKRLEQKTANEYVSQSLAEIMEKLGYDVIGTENLSLKSKDITKNYYKISENSALNISTSSDGAVMFEVLANNEKNALNSAEKRSVRQDMERFCPDYFKIKNALLEFGISIGDEHLCEADEKYVRSVDLSKFGEILDESKRRTAKKRLDYLQE
ncbi:MAG: hypothetical protein RR540_04310 [Oscillospiraceae bacterium]